MIYSPPYLLTRMDRAYACKLRRNVSFATTARSLKRLKYDRTRLFTPRVARFFLRNYLTRDLCCTYLRMNVDCAIAQDYETGYYASV